MSCGPVICGLAALLVDTVPGAGQATSRATADRADLSVAARVATTGFGVEVAKLLSGHLVARAGGGLYSWSTTRSQSDIRYAASLKVHSFQVLFDLSPGWRSSFHFTAGVASNPLTITGSGQPSAAGTFNINGTEYTTSQVGTLTAEGKFPSALPYLGLGLGTPANDHRALKLVFDLGAIIGEPAISLTSSAAAPNSQLASDLQAQAARTQHDLRKFLKAYPVISLGLAFGM